MKPPYHIGAVCIAMALAACSGTQNGSITNPVPAVGAPQTASIAGAHKASAALILVANENTGLGGSIREYAESANGNVAPKTVISNHNGGPYAIAVNPSQGIGIANGNIDSSGQSGAETFALTATGNAQPLTAIECFTKPSQTNGMAFDSAGNLYVADISGRTKAIDIFAPGANGCISPMRTIPDTGGLAIDSNNVLYVANKTTATIDLFPSGSNTMEAQIGGSNTGLGAPGTVAVPPDTVAVDASLNVYVFDTKTATISEFAAGAHGNVAPIRTIAGSKTGLGGGNGFSFGLAVSKTSGKIFVSNPGSNAILGFAATASGNVAPIQTIAGSATGLGDPLGLVVTD
jgi:hypothetical protein